MNSTLIILLAVFLGIVTLGLLIFSIIIYFVKRKIRNFTDRYLLKNIDGKEIANLVLRKIQDKLNVKIFEENIK